MDLYKAIRQLYEERARLDRVIASLEELQRAAGEDSEGEGPRRRGRKAMSEEERRQVSERMKQYWADRRKKPKR
jgi:hypothetical protein